MKKRIIGAALAVSLLGIAVIVYADATQSFDPNVGTAGDGLRGYHAGEPSADWASHPLGFSLDVDSAPKWTFGLTSSSLPDFYMQSHTSHTNTFWMRGDTGQLNLGQTVGQPLAGWTQLVVTAGTSAAPLDGVGVVTYGFNNNLNLIQGNAGSNHTDIDFAGSWQVGSDVAGNGGKDLFVYDLAHSTIPLTVSNSSDMVNVNFGATINGGATVNGPSSLLGNTTIGAANSTVGFYGATPQSRPVITGCRSDGTAMASLLQKLQAMGLVTDQTTP